MNVEPYKDEDQLTLTQAAMLIGLFGIVVICLIAPTFGRRTHHSIDYKNIAQLRGIHQSSVIFAQSNGYHFPGLDASGQLLPDGKATGFSGDGGTVEARFWILLQGQFVVPEMLANPMETIRPKWTTGSVVTAHYSYAALRIGEAKDTVGRRTEWGDNANALAVMFSDRNTQSGLGPHNVKSLWTKNAGEWNGGIIFGDGHAMHADSAVVESTRYGKVQTTNDHLFIEDPGAHGANALMVR